MGSTIRTYINGVNFANLVDDERSEGFIALQVHGIGNNEALGRKGDSLEKYPDPYGGSWKISEYQMWNWPRR